MYVNSIKMRMLCVCMTIVLTLGLMPVWAVSVKAEEKLSVSGTDGGYTQDENGNITITNEGTYTITGTDEPTLNTIKVADGVKNVDITLDNVNIDASNTTSSAFALEFDNDVNLTLCGSNTLISANNYAGLQVLKDSTLTITGDGSISATGGYYGAGIGGSYADGTCDCGTVTINGGIVTAIGNGDSAGIGGAGYWHGYGGSGGTITVNGGTVTAKSGSGYAADIGFASFGSQGTLTITGGSVNAEGIGPSTVYYDSDQTTPAYLTKVTVGATPVKSENVTYKINGGSDIKASTDENGILYLWLAQNNELEYYNRSTTIDITAGGTTYTVSGAISGSSDNELTALLVPKITTLPTASSVTTGDKLSSSVLTGGVAEGINGEKLTGIFSWTYPNEVLSTTNLYTVTFTPDNSNYKSVTFIVEVPVDAKEYLINDGSVEISKCGTYKITGTGIPTSNTIKVDKGLRNVYITLDNVNIDASATTSSAFSLEYGDSIFLVLKGDNVLKGGSLGAGLKIGSTSDIYILGNPSEDKADGTLTAIGGNKGAGIGGSGNGSDNSCGKVISQEAFVNAIGGAEAAGIGGGAGGNGGDILVLGGSIVTKGNGGAADIGHGSGSSNDGSVTIEYGSVKAENMGPSTVYYDDNKTIPAYLTKVALGVSPLKSQYFLYVVNDSGSISSSTDENGIFYLWLPVSSSSKLYMYWKNELYKASGAIAASNDNMLTAMADSRITQLPTASSVYYGNKLIKSELSGGIVTGVLGKEIAGKFTWDDPDTIMKTPGDYYSVTFTPDNPNYKCTSAKIKVLGIQEEDDDIPSGNSGGSTTVSGGNTTASNTSKTTTDTTTLTNVIDVKSVAASDGTATSNVTDNQVNESLNKVSTQHDGNNQTLEIKVSGSESATGFSTIISNTSLEKINKYGHSLDIDTQVGSVKFDSSALKSIEKNSSGSVNITIYKVDPSSLSNEKQSEIGNRPVYKLTVTSGEKNISDFGSGTATVSIPYTLKDGEDPNKIVVYYITESGELKTVADCVYDASKDCVIFKTNHFSNYMIGYNDVTFSDLSGWYENYVNFISARNIMSGFGNKKFSPDDNITRAQFVTMLAKLYGKDLSANNHSSFEDVSKSDWYFAAVQWACDNGIVKGSDGKFNPNAYITREQLALMLYNYANYADIHISSDEGLVAEKFSDYDDISKWAKGPIEWASKLEIISGDDKGYFRPKKIATRAEAAKVIDAFLHEVTK